MTNIIHSETDLIHAADSLCEWSNILLEEAPLTAQQREDITAINNAAKSFIKHAKNEQQTLSQSADAEAKKAVRHQLRNHLNIVVGFSQLLLAELPDNLLMHMVILRDIHQTGKDLLTHVDAIE